MQTTTITKAFNALTIIELYAILRLRSEVFVVEQDCVYQDLDNKDQKGYHLLIYVAAELACYCRLLPAGVSFAEQSIGRVIVAKDFRKHGLGKQLIEEAVKESYALFGHAPIRIGAQLHLTHFYETAGFITQGIPYDEDGIAHIEMLKP